MSSGPVGLDVREYSYGYFTQTVDAGGVLSVDGRKAWWITKIQLFAGAAGAVMRLTFKKDSGTQGIVVAANGCVVLEPNGAHKGGVMLSGAVGALLIIEYWFQTQEAQLTPAIPVDHAP
jgi:hypothetical protein